MTKQEKIKEWINKYLTKQFICDPSELPDDECLNEANKILSYLHSQGVVIKVERELPKAGIRGLSDEEAKEKTDVWITACEHMILFGYVAVEPLIKESKKEELSGN